MSKRAGFSIVETLVALLVLGVIGASMAQVLMVQNQFIQKQEGASVARQTARNGSNVMLSELRRVQVGSGVVAATATSITLRVPFAIGVVCGHTGTTSTTVAMMPVDSVGFEDAVGSLSGFAWRDDDGDYQYESSSVSADTLGVPSICTGASPPITQLPGGKRVQVTPQAGAGAAPSGVPLFLYQHVRYEFRSSVSVPGSIGLWRILVDAGSNEELVAPFDATARFRFFTDGSSTAQAAVPADLGDITGIEFQLVSLNERSRSTDVVPYTTAVFFKNR